MWAFAALFFLEAASLALFVTPLWDVPDEVAHFAYVSDLADGRGIPRLGSTEIPPELARSWQPQARGPVLNWTAVHPPGYHLVAVPFLAIARLFGADLEWQVRITRLASALFGALALLVLYRVLREGGAGPAASLAAAVGVGTIPMYSHLAGGVDQDVLSALLGALAALFWVRAVRERAEAPAIAMAVSLAAAGAVKLTALPIAAALPLLLPWRLPGPPRRRLAVWTLCAAIALSTPALWIVRQKTIGVGSGVPTLSRHPRNPAAFLRYLSENPVADHTFKNFLGLIGWSGTGHGTLSWFQISGVFLAPYLIGAVLLSLAAAAWIARTDRQTGSARRAAARIGWALGAAAFVLAFAGLTGPAAGPGALGKRLVYALVVAVPCVGLARVWLEREPMRFLVFSAQTVFLAAVAVYAANAWSASEIAGALRSTHGRYLFGAIAFLLLAFVLPAERLLADTSPGSRNRAWLLALAILVLNDVLFFGLRVIPFYRAA
jgi:Dolichyl-phosphate-mannose-protein mannosyltransferase